MMASVARTRVPNAQNARSELLKAFKAIAEHSLESRTNSMTDIVVLTKVHSVKTANKRLDIAVRSLARRPKLMTVTADPTKGLSVMSVDSWLP